MAALEEQGLFDPAAFAAAAALSSDDEGSEGPGAAHRQRGYVSRGEAALLGAQASPTGMALAEDEEGIMSNSTALQVMFLSSKAPNHLRCARRAGPWGLAESRAFFLAGPGAGLVLPAR